MLLASVLLLLLLVSLGSRGFVANKGSFLGAWIGWPIKQVLFRHSRHELLAVQRIFAGSLTCRVCSLMDSALARSLTLGIIIEIISSCSLILLGSISLFAFSLVGNSVDSYFLFFVLPDRS